MDLFKNKEIKSIDIVFENCESFNVSSNAIESCFIKNIQVDLDINYNGLQFSHNPGEMMYNYGCDFIKLALNKEAFNVKCNWDDGETLYDRIDNDITHFDLIFNDGSSLYLYVPWGGDDMYENDNCSIIKKDEMIFIVISKDKNIIKDVNDSFEEYYKVEIQIKNDFIPNSVEIMDNSTYYSYSVPNYVVAALNLIREKLNIIMWNINQEEYENPFDNTGNEFHCDVFDVKAYNWDEDEEQEYNFKWKDYKISWYKYFGRDTTSNREMSADECATMLDECINTINEMRDDD